MIKYNVEPQPNSIIMVNWQSTAPYYTSWQSVGEIYGCSNWTPDESTIIIGQTFIQDRNCNINQERLRQDRELSSKGSYKDIGNPQLETRIETVNQTRNNTGLMESWVAIGSIYGEWTNSGNLYDCTNWTPAPSTVNSGVSFQQEATDCKQNQVRTKQDREQETTTLTIRNIGSETNENQTLTNQLSSRTSTGTKVNNVCSYDFSMNPSIFAWWQYGATQYFWASNHSVVPELWVNVNTGKAAVSDEVIPGLTKISSTEFNYSINGSIWKITKGTFNNSTDGYNYYNLCYSKIQ